MSRAEANIARRNRFVTRAALALVTGSLALAACGGDEETTTVTVPATTEPTTTAEGATTTTEETAIQTTTEDDGGVEPEPGDDSGGSGEGADSGAADTPQNDITPPSNTPQGKFEQFCNENPGACG